MNDRYAIDLTSVKKALESHDDLSDFVNSIRQFEDSSSVLCELRYDVLGCLDTLSEIQPSLVAVEKFSAALTTHAVISYCRATHSKGRARDHIGATRYTPDQWEKHKKIVDLRDKVFAHQGFPTKDHGLRWRDERASVRIVGEAENPVFSRTRANYLAAAIADLRELATIAEVAAQKIRDQRSRFMNEVYLRHAGDPRVIEAMALRFDPIGFFGPGQVADDYWVSDGDSVGAVHGRCP